MNTARPKKPLYCYWPGLMETLEMDCTKMDWALFSHPFNIQSGWKKNTWQPPYFLLPQFSNVTCPQFRSRMFCARKAWQIVFLCPRELKTHWGKTAKNIFNKKKTLLQWTKLSHFQQSNFVISFLFKLIASIFPNSFQTNFLPWLHCALSNACHTPITIISRLSQR